MSTEPFHPTTVNVQAFHYTTDESGYQSTTSTVGTEVHEWLESQRADMWENGLTFHITLQNLTKAQMGKGVIPMPKGHRDGAMTGEEASTASEITKWLNTAIADLLQKAKY